MFKYLDKLEMPKYLNQSNSKLVYVNLQNSIPGEYGTLGRY